MAVHNDVDHIARALETALAQTVRNIEVVCVDDASTDGTLSVVNRFEADPRVRVIRMESNCSAYQARRIGIQAASADFVLFLDGDDELSPDAVEVTLAKASGGSADVVGFGVEMVMPVGQGTPRFERSLQPKHKELHGERIISALFPSGQPAQGHLWRYLFSTELLRYAYSGTDGSQTFYRANDIPVSFLALSVAKKYVSTHKRLYRYFFRRGSSGQSINSVAEFEFYLTAIDSLDSIDQQVQSHARTSYLSARRSLIGNLVRDCLERTSGSLQADCFARLEDRVGPLEIVLAAADFCRESLPMLVDRLSHLEVQPVREAQSVVVTTSHLKTGGLQGVLAAQVRHLVHEGIRVTVALHQRGASDHLIGSEADSIEIAGSSWAEKIRSLLDICVTRDVDTVVDHHLLYNEYWPFYALAAQAVGIGTIGWLHNFALRPMFDGSTRLSFLKANLPTLETVVVLSPTDVAFWSMNDVDNVVYLPNPPSPILVDRGMVCEPRQLGAGPIELVWWGRLQQSTKQVSELLQVAQQLRLQGADFHMSIIGPDGPDLTAESMDREVHQMGLDGFVKVLGPLHGDELTSALASADLCLMTSAIEGYPLTLIEGQALGLPVVMYELPWLAYLTANDGVKTVPQREPKQLAQAIADFVDDPQSYEAASAAALEAARKIFDLDFGKLYRQLIEKQLDVEFSPSPSLEQCRTLLRLSVEYSERTSRLLYKSRSDSDSLRKRLASAPYAAPKMETPLPDIQKFQRYRKKSGSLLRRILAMVLPSTWKQANYISERHAKWNRDALTSIARQQRELTRSVLGLQQAVKESTVRTSDLERHLRDSDSGFNDL